MDQDYLLSIGEPDILAETPVFMDTARIQHGNARNLQSRCLSKGVLRADRRWALRIQQKFRPEEDFSIIHYGTAPTQASQMVHNFGNKNATERNDGKASTDQPRHNI